MKNVRPVRSAADRNAGPCLCRCPTAASRGVAPADVGAIPVAYVEAWTGVSSARARGERGLSGGVLLY